MTTEASTTWPELSAERRLNLHWAVTMMRVRDLRERVLGGKGQFADPAWDLLLDLYVTTLQNQPLAVGDACVGARVPHTTALRWIDHLEKLGSVERSPDPRDGRRTLVRLTDAQLCAMDIFFRSMQELVPSIGES